MGGRGMRPDAYGAGMGWGLWGILGLVVLLALAATVVWLSVKLNRVTAGRTTPVTAPPVGTPGGAPDALALLDERLARGDLDVTDYTARRRALLGELPPNDHTRIEPLA